MSDDDEKEEDGPSSIDLTHHENTSGGSGAFISFESIIECCSSITQTAINCPSFQQQQQQQHFAHLPRSASTINNNHHNDSYQDEVELSKWLDCQISDLQTAFHSIPDPQSLSNRHHYHRLEEEEENNKNKSDFKKKEHEIRKLRQELLLETVLEQQERLYLSRLKMSLAASYTKLSPINNNSNNNSNDNINNDVDNEEIDKHQQVLVREALKIRDREVLSALEKTKKADQYQRELDGFTQKHKSLIRKNQTIWNELLSNEIQTTIKADETQQLPPSNNHNDSSSSSNNKNNNNIHKQLSNEDYLRNETNLLKHAMIDITINSGLDWYSDPRLNNIMMKLEE